MTTHETKAGFGQSAGGDLRGFLRLVLKLDAVATGVVGIVMLLAAGTVVGDGRPFVELLGTPLSLMVPVGVFLVVYAAFVWIVGSRRRVGEPVVWAAVAVNAVYAVGCIVVVAAGWFPLTTLGVLFVLAQAVAVALFAILQFIGLRQSHPATG